MNKKGQLTLIIIIGIMIVFSAAIIIYLQQQVELAGFKEDALSTLTEETQPVKVYVDKCLKDTAVHGIYYMGTQGGYISPPLESLLTESSIIPYYYQNNLKTMPSLSALENEISIYVEDTLTVCTNRFPSFPFDIEETKPRVTTKINNDNIMIKVFYPLEIKLKSRTEKIENFVYKAPIRFGHVYDVADKVVEKQISRKDIFDMLYLASFDVNVDILPYDGRTMVFSITDRKSETEGVDYQLFFANRFDLNSPPRISFIPDFVLGVNKNFEYTVTASDPDDDAVTYSDDSELFSINPSTGIISFTPAAAGTYNAVITAADTKGNTDSANIIFTVR